MKLKRVWQQPAEPALLHELKQPLFIDSLVACAAEDSRLDTVDYTPPRGGSPAHAQPGLPDHHVGASQAPAEPHVPRAVRVGSLTEPAPTMSAAEHPFSQFVPAPSAATAPEFYSQSGMEFQTWV